MLITAVVRDDILFLNLNDPESRNALSFRAARELLNHIGKKNFSALVFSSTGRVFCSGGKLSVYASMATADEGRKINDEIRSILEALTSLDVPTLAAVGGDAFGGGVELLGCFDFVVAAPHALFGLWQRKIGLSFGWGGGARIEKRIGAAHLKSLALSTAAISAHEAARIGLVDFVVQESELLSKAEGLARALLALPSEPVAGLKAFEASREVESFQSLWWNPSHKAVLASRKR
jgi:enoyl-CoA hydratase/carnithine racemase